MRPTCSQASQLLVSISLPREYLTTSQSSQHTVCIPVFSHPHHHLTTSQLSHLMQSSPLLASSTTSAFVYLTFLHASHHRTSITPLGHHPLVNCSSPTPRFTIMPSLIIATPDRLRVCHIFVGRRGACRHRCAQRYLRLGPGKQPTSPSSLLYSHSLFPYTSSPFGSYLLFLLFSVSSPLHPPMPVPRASPLRLSPEILHRSLSSLLLSFALLVKPLMSINCRASLLSEWKTAGSQVCRGGAASR